jgi:hypothetical protein
MVKIVKMVKMGRNGKVKMVKMILLVRSIGLFLIIKNKHVKLGIITAQNFINTITLMY